jgi:hypothetical protein
MILAGCLASESARDGKDDRIQTRWQSISRHRGSQIGRWTRALSVARLVGSASAHDAPNRTGVGKIGRHQQKCVPPSLPDDAG